MRRLAIALTLTILVVTPAHASRPRGVEVRVLPSRVDAVIDHTGPYSELSGTFVHLLDWISEGGWWPVARGVGVYFDDPSRVLSKKLRSQARIPVNVYGKYLPDPPPGSERGYLERTEPVVVVSAVHVGPYDKVFPTYGMLFQALPAMGLRYVGPMQEVYLNDPADTPPDKLRTEVQLVVEPQGKADIGLYADWGGYGPGVEAASACFAAAGLSIRPLKARDINDGSFARKVRVLYMPGGWAEHYVRDIDAKGATAIERFVESGGGYIGICAGAYYSAKQIVWANKTWPYDIDLFPGIPTGPINAIAPWPRYATTPITLKRDHPITAEGPVHRTALYYGGPILKAREDAAVTVLATYDATGDPAMVAFAKGKGRVFLSSAHLEYDLRSERDHTAWPEKEKGIDDPESDWDLLQRAALWVLGRKK